MRIAYVEDNPTNLALVERVASMNQHLIVSYSEGEIALQELGHEKFDLILMDVELAGELSGLQVVKRLREGGLVTPIVAVTAYAMMGDRDRCIEAGCNDYLPKPLPINDLIALLAKYDAQTHGAPEVARPAAPVAQPAVPAVQPPAPVAQPAAASPAATPKPATPTPATPAPAAAPAPISAQPAAPAVQPVAPAAKPAEPAVKPAEPASPAPAPAATVPAAAPTSPAEPKVASPATVDAVPAKPEAPQPPVQAASPQTPAEPVTVVSSGTAAPQTTGHTEPNVPASDRPEDAKPLTHTP